MYGCCTNKSLTDSICLLYMLNAVLAYAKFAHMILVELAILVVYVLCSNDHHASQSCPDYIALSLIWLALVILQGVRMCFQSHYSFTDFRLQLALVARPMNFGERLVNCFHNIYHRGSRFTQIPMYFLCLFKQQGEPLLPLTDFLFYTCLQIASYIKYYNQGQISYIA